MRASRAFLGLYSQRIAAPLPQDAFGCGSIRIGGPAIVGSAAAAGAGDPKRWQAGAYSFSDELGGFRSSASSGNGTKDDPIVITEEINSAIAGDDGHPHVRPIRPFDYSGRYANGFTACARR